MSARLSRSFALPNPPATAARSPIFLPLPIRAPSRPFAGKPPRKEPAKDANKRETRSLRTRVRSRGLFFMREPGWRALRSAAGRGQRRPPGATPLGGPRGVPRKLFPPPRLPFPLSRSLFLSLFRAHSRPFAGKPPRERARERRERARNEEPTDADSAPNHNPVWSATRDRGQRPLPQELLCKAAVV